MKKALVLVFVMVVCSLFASKREVAPLIRSVRLSKDKKSMKVMAHPEFSKNYLRWDFFVAYHEVDLTKLDYTIVTAPFIMNVISAVLISGDTYSVEAMDEELFYSIKKLKEVFKVMFPKKIWDGELIPEKLVKNTLSLSPDSEMAVLFSNGLDSVFTSLSHRDKKQLLITGWGQVDIPLGKKKLWQSRKREMVAFGKKYGHDNAFVRSNFSNFRKHPKLEALSSEIYEWRNHAVEDIGWIRLTLPLLVAKGVDKLYIASSDTWTCPVPCAANPFIDNNISIAGISFIHDAFDYTRQDKVQGLSVIKNQLGLATLIIKACAEGVFKNCCACSKCLQTAFGLFVLGEDPKEYGYYASLNSMIEAAQSLDINSLSIYERFQFRQVQKELERCTNEHIKEALHWLLVYDINGELHDYEKGRVPVNWKKLSELFPAISVPTYALLPITLFGDPILKEKK